MTRLCSESVVLFHCMHSVSTVMIRTKYVSVCSGKYATTGKNRGYRLSGDKSMTLTIKYKEYVGRTRPEYTIDWCCEGAEMSSIVNVLPSHKQDSPEEPEVGVIDHERMMGEYYTEVFDYCPFCGDSIEAESLGKFKTKTVEERVD